MANREQFRQPSFFRLNRYLNRIAPISRRLPFAVALARDAVAQGVSLQATLRGRRLFLVVASPAWARGIVGAFYFHRIPLQNGITYQYAICGVVARFARKQIANASTGASRNAQWSEERPGRTVDR